MISALFTRRSLLASGTGAAASATLTSSARANEVADVIVIGAGLSGLNAALLLEEQGFRVTVLEGRNRPGGRLYTFDDVPGTPEAGGSGIGRGYARLIFTAEKLGIKLEPQRARTEVVREDSLIDQARPVGKPCT
jgi:monoamine oxidase